MPADPGILKRIRRARRGRVTVRFRANGYSLYSRRSNLPLCHGQRKTRFQIGQLFKARNPAPAWP